MAQKEFEASSYEVQAQQLSLVKQDLNESECCTSGRSGKPGCAGMCVGRI